MKRERLIEISTSEGESDVRRLAASAVLLKADGKAHHSAAIAADLGWTLRRVETAAIAAEEHGLLTRTPKRRI